MLPRYRQPKEGPGRRINAGFLSFLLPNKIKTDKEDMLK
jgi:hypothetical protein